MKCKLLLSYNYSVGNLNSYNAHIFQTTGFRTYVYWTFSSRTEPKNTSFSYGHPIAGHLYDNRI
jgi:hypothetical protein